MYFWQAYDKDGLPYDYDEEIESLVEKIKDEFGEKGLSDFIFKYVWANLDND